MQTEKSTKKNIDSSIRKKKDCLENNDSDFETTNTLVQCALHQGIPG